MIENKVVSLFARQAASQTGPSKDKLQTREKKRVATKLNSILPALKKLELNSRHPKTGLKYGGYMPLSCVVFVPDLFSVLNPGQFKTYLYLTFLNWRYPEQSGQVRASQRYLCHGTGLSRSAVSEHLGDLESFGLIERIETNRNLGNLYRIIQFNLTPEQQETEKPIAGIQTTDVRNSSHGGQKNNPPWPEKQAKDYTLLSSLSLSQHEGFSKRWERLSKKATIRERAVIKALLEEYPGDLDEIYHCLIEIESTGKTYNGQVCYSPIGLISSSWPSIKRIRQAKTNNPEQNFKSPIDPLAEQNRECILADIQNYISSLNQQEAEELHRIVETEIRKARPQIGEFSRDSRIYQSFLETTVASRLGQEIPESN